MHNQLTDPKRLAALHKTGLLDSPDETEFDRITRLVRRVLSVDVCLVSLVDANRQFFKSSSGLGSPWREARETPLTHSFCQHVVTSNSPLIVGDATRHPLVCDNKAIRDLSVASYLGVPIRGADGEVLGSLCAIRITPSEWTDDDRSVLEDFAGVIENEIALRLAARQAKQLAHDNATLAQEYHHRVKNALTVAATLFRLSAREATSIADAVSAADGRLKSLADAHDALMLDSDKVDLERLLKRLLAPYQRTDRTGCVTAGPPVTLTLKQVTPICLIVHELATNSVKYGAINNGADLSLTWSIADATVTIEWIEASSIDGDPLKRRAGFGTRLLDVAAAQLGGTLAIVATNPLTIEIAFSVG